MSSPNESFHVILAEKKHDRMMRDILEDSSFQGKISLTYLREPSVYDSFQKEGKSYIFLLMTEHETAVGMGVLTIREICLQQKKMRLGYLSSLRIRPAFQKKFLHMALMYQRMYEMTKQEVDLYLTTILAENEAARRLFEKKRRSMPLYHAQGQINTYFTGYKKGTDLPQTHSYQATFDGMPTVALPDARYMHLDGLTAYTLDNSANKVYKVTGYTGIYRLIPYLPLRHLGLPRFPKPGQNAHYLAGGIYGEPSGRDTMHKMVQALRNQARGYDFMMISALKGSLLDQVLSEQKGAVCYQSLLYEVLFEGMKPHELASLALDAALL